ncbi:DNA cytosine methyltransferase [Lacrimispora sp.]|uniref:DNA cytosine methyltransferase n=1 Tax=Lacrimispora sp. TaxID=2719234 RepID=UPI0028AB347A|nr:DNA cytosine methyltransferase [Lacrimispora sp.]
MLKDKSLTYVSLFSCAGVGCYGFHMEGYHCVATNELLPRRLDVQKTNHKCEYESGYISGDITASEVKQQIYEEIERWETKGNDRVDVVVATPPCQGISVINHKKNSKEINRNSLVVESVEVIKTIRPRFFIFENVMAFQKTLCITPDNRIIPIGDYIREALGEDYIISGRILNFMNYGSNSSRTRTLMIGVDKKFRDNIAPLDLYPDYRKEKTLRDVIFNFPRLEWGEIQTNDFYHAFRTYNHEMRTWIHDLKEGESAFDNEDPLKRPHRNIDGKVVENIRKNRDKYTRQPWDRFVQCVHTRNDQLAAQNTIHPEQDRVYSIRELMAMMTIPVDFQWMEYSLTELNEMTEAEKKKIYKAHEVNIRQCIGEAVPTEIMFQIAAKIKIYLFGKRCDATEVNKIISQRDLTNRDSLTNFLKENPLDLDMASLMRITELCNARREKNAAFYTNKFIVNEIMGQLPTFNKDEIRILEPSVGAGSFVPFLFKQYESVPHVILDVIDIDEESIEAFNLLLDRIGVPDNFTVNCICHDFLIWEVKGAVYDLAVGNPPFSKLKKHTKEIDAALKDNTNHRTNNLAAMFLEKCMRCSDCVALVLNKNILATEEYADTRNLLRTMRIDTIIDFGRYGFTGVSIETMCMIVYPKQKPKDTSVYNMKYNRKLVRSQNYITDEQFPSFIIYRDEQFDKVAEKLEFNVFSVFRDRQITKSMTTSQKGDDTLWIIKARNINDDGLGITHIDNYDVFLPEQIAESMSVARFINDKNVYLTPNMTYNPRVIENLPDTIPDGSVAVLIPKKPIRLTARQKAFFSTSEYRRFYGIARNLSTQSINVDNNSVFFYGVLKDDK